MTLWSLETGGQSSAAVATSKVEYMYCTFNGYTAVTECGGASVTVGALVPSEYINMQ